LPFLQQATVETVIKVSGNKRQEPEPVPVETPALETPPSPAEEQGTINSIIHHSWGHLHDRKQIPEVVRALCCIA
jgi:hypothetical protein